jgi:hypothetical protein
MNYQKEILNLDKVRYELIDQEETPENDKKIDEYADKILALINEGKDQLKFEFIFEQLTRLGQAPCLLYDDDGHFAMLDEGFCTAVSEGPIDWDGVFSIKKEDWANTIREALEKYLKRF